MLRTSKRPGRAVGPHSPTPKTHERGGVPGLELAGARIRAQDFGVCRPPGLVFYIVLKARALCFGFFGRRRIPLLYVPGARLWLDVGFFHKDLSAIDNMIVLVSGLELQ